MLGKNSRIYAGSTIFSDTFTNPQGDDPTALYPNGFPATEPLEIQLGSQDIVLSAFSGGGPITQWLSLPVDQFADMSKHNQVDMEKVGIGKTQLIRLVVDRVTWSASFRSDEYDYSAPMIPWSQAPEALRKQFDYIRSRGGGGLTN